MYDFFLFVHTFSCLVSGASLLHPVPFSLPAKDRASSLFSATVKTRGSTVGTSGLTAGSWYVLAGTARQLACAEVQRSQVTLNPKASSPSQRASAVWTTGSPYTSLHLKPSPVRKVRELRSRRRNKGLRRQEMGLIVGL